MRLVLFDCDGTLVDSVGVIHQCMETSFREHGYGAPPEVETRSVIGLTLNLAIARLLARDVDEEIEEITATYRRNFMAYRKSGAPLEPLFSGVRPLLEALSGEPDVILGIVTGKSRRGLDAILAHHGIAHFFLPIRTADDCPSKPHPAMVLECCGETGIDPQSTYVIGDAIFDVAMARAAGATAIGVSWGYAAADALAEAGAHHIVAEAGEIAAILAKGALSHA